MVKKVFSTFLLIGLLFPTITEAGFSPEGKPRKKRCKGSEGVLVCRVPKPKKPKKCSLKRPCTPPGYYRKTPPRFIRMG